MVVLGDLIVHKASLLFGSGLYVLLSRNCSFPDLFWKTLADVRFETYYVDDNGLKIEVEPDVIVTGFGNDVESEIKAQLVNLHCQNDVITVYVIDAERGFTHHKSLETVYDSSTQKHALVNLDRGYGLAGFFNQFSPKLVQLKHHQQSYQLGGEVVSPFSAYDPNNPSAAEALLRRAMSDYQGLYDRDNPPDDLYTWDVDNKCYVVFHHSGRWEYHGHNLQSPYTLVPKYIKEKYHIKE
jgi:hypothetical protein